MTRIIASRRTTDPDQPAFTSYEIQTEEGKIYTVRKEFYADGPSMYEWRVNGPGLEEELFNTKKACMRAIEELS